MVQLSIAVDENTTATEDHAAPETTWVRVTIWDELAEQLAEQPPPNTRGSPRRVAAGRR
jgi:single-stranded DNA-binding protein